MAIEIQLERMRVVEAMSARDNVVLRLTDAHVSICQKVTAIERLELERDELRRRLSAAKGPCDEAYEDEKTKFELAIEKLQGTIARLEEELRVLKDASGKPSIDLPPSYEEGKTEAGKVCSPSSLYSALFLIIYADVLLLPG